MNNDLASRYTGAQIIAALDFQLQIMKTEMTDHHSQESRYYILDLIGQCQQLTTQYLERGKGS